MDKKKIAVLTGGGDAPGLNAVIYTLTKTCILKYGYELIGYKFGYRGLYTNDFMPLTLENTTGILHKGGSILYSSNKDNLFDYKVKDENGNVTRKDVSDVAIDNMKKENVDVLCILGGDGTLASAYDFSKKGVNIIGVPKTIDNDLAATDRTFGFNTAVNIVTEALGRLHTTAESHHRVIIVEVMGRNAGWIALYGGIAGSADIILIPEIPYTLDNIVQKIHERDSRGKLFTIIVVSEGAMELGGTVTVNKVVQDSPDPIRLGGIANKLTYQLEAKLGEEHEIRPVVLGHTQRGGETSPYDRILSARFGSYAAKMIHEEKYGNMVCLDHSIISHVPLKEVVGRQKKIDPKTDELVQVARDLGVSFGDRYVIREK